MDNFDNLFSILSLLQQPELGAKCDRPCDRLSPGHTDGDRLPISADMLGS